MSSSRKLRRDVEVLIEDYIGLKLRERTFDPRGQGSTSALDDLAHYDLAVGVALWWLDREQGPHGPHDLHRHILGASHSLGGGGAQYPDRLEREAMILSAFAGIIMNSLPVDQILTLYGCKPSFTNQRSKGSIVYPFPLSSHPFAMLGSYGAVQHSKNHNQKLRRWLTEREKINAPPRQAPPPSSSSSSSSSFLSDSSEDQDVAAQHYEGSQESLQD